MSVSRPQLHTQRLFAFEAVISSLLPSERTQQARRPQLGWSASGKTHALVDCSFGSDRVFSVRGVRERHLHLANATVADTCICAITPKHFVAGVFFPLNWVCEYVFCVRRRSGMHGGMRGYGGMHRYGTKPQSEE